MAKHKYNTSRERGEEKLKKKKKNVKFDNKIEK